MRHICLLAWLALPALAADTKVVEEIIAKVNGEIVTRSEMERSGLEIRAEMERGGLSADKLEETVKERQKDVLRDLVDQSLLTQKGKELNISVETQLIRYLDEMRRQNNIASMEEFEKWAVEQSGGAAYEDLKERIRNQMLTQRVIGQEVGSRISVPKEEIAKYYEEHKGEFVRPEQVRLSEILVSTEGKQTAELPALEKKANDVLARLRKGERFPEVARKMSDSESAKQGGDIGFFKKGVLDKEIEKLAFELRRGSLSDVLKRPNGFLILRVEERHQEGQASLADVEQDILERLYGPRMQPALREYLTKLRQNAFIEIRAGFVDSAAAAGQDTTWKDAESFQAAVTTKADAVKKKKRLLWVLPRPGGGGKQKESKQPPAAPRPAEPAKPAEQPKIQ